METSAQAVLGCVHFHLSEHPDDWIARLQLADVLDDLGEAVLAAGQRWQVREGARPYHAAGLFGWFDASHFSGVIDPQSDLPPALFARLPLDTLAPGESDEWSRWYPTRAAADEAIARALAREGVGG